MPPQPPLPKIQNKNNNKKKKISVPIQCLERAMVQCEWLLIEREHDDIDLSGTFVSNICIAQASFYWIFFLSFNCCGVINRLIASPSTLYLLFCWKFRKKTKYEIE